MKVLWSTKLTQGQRESDFSFTSDGELLYLGFECDTDKEADGGCGCKRAFCGMNSGLATTTALVVEVDGRKDWFVGLYISAMERAGWLTDKSSEESRASFRDAASEVLEIAARFDVGAVVEKRMDTIQVRRAA